jgi:hypothetical protein
VEVAILHQLSKLSSRSSLLSVAVPPSLATVTVTAAGVTSTIRVLLPNAIVCILVLPSGHALCQQQLQLLVVVLVAQRGSSCSS